MYGDEYYGDNTSGSGSLTGVLSQLIDAGTQLGTAALTQGQTQAVRSPGLAPASSMTSGTSITAILVLVVAVIAGIFLWKKL